MTTAKELGTEGLKSLIGKEVLLKYPKTKHRKSHRRKATITEVLDKGKYSPDTRLVGIEGEGLIWIWDETDISTDISEVRPNRIEQLLQRIRRK